MELLTDDAMGVFHRVAFDAMNALFTLQIAGQVREHVLGSAVATLSGGHV